jgi:hypothetical protein
MKKITSFATIGIFLILTIIILSNCKKKDEPVVPAFTVTAITVPLQSGGDGLQFHARCTNNEVKMKKVLITEPNQTLTYTYLLNDQIFGKDQDFGLQTTEQAYPKLTGTWTFILEGSRTSDGQSFTVNASLTIGK